MNFLLLMLMLKNILTLSSMKTTWWEFIVIKEIDAPVVKYWLSCKNYSARSS